MITPGLDRMWYYGQRHQELLAEAKRHRLVQEALKAGQPKFHNSSKILVYIAKKLTTHDKSLMECYYLSPFKGERPAPAPLRVISIAPPAELYSSPVAATITSAGRSIPSTVRTPVGVIRSMDVVTRSVSGRLKIGRNALEITGPGVVRKLPFPSPHGGRLVAVGKTAPLAFNELADATEIPIVMAPLDGVCPVGPMTEPRKSPLLARAGDSVLVVGGPGASGEPLATAELYERASATFIAIDVPATLMDPDNGLAGAVLTELADGRVALTGTPLVMAEDKKVRQNRLGLLQSISKMLLEIADYSLVVVEGEKGSRPKGAR